MSAIDDGELVLVRKEQGRFYALCGQAEAWHPTSGLGAARRAGARHLGLPEEQVEVDVLSARSVIVRERRECARTRWWSPLGWAIFACAVVAVAVSLTWWIGGGR